MKKTLFLLGLLSLVTLVSCKHEDLQQPKQSPRFYGVLEQPISDVATRVHMDETNHFFWNYGDLLSIFYRKTYNRQFMFIGDNHTTAGDFERSDQDSPYATEQNIETEFDYAIFPWNKNNACNTQGVVDVVIPSNQEFYDDSFGVGLRPLLVARAPKDNRMFYFKHVGSYIAIHLKGDGISVTSISFQGNDSETIAGKLSVSFDSNGLPVVGSFISTSALVPISSTISMTFDTPIVLDKDAEKVVWLVVPSGEYSGYTLTVTDQEGGTFQRVRSEPLTLERAVSYPMNVNVTITPPTIPVTGITVAPTTLEMIPGEEQELTATIAPSDATDQNVTWTSSDDNVATVDDNGKVTAVAAGTATITVTTEDGDLTATCEVTVKDVVTYNLVIDPAENAEVNAGSTIKFKLMLTTTTNGVAAEPADVAAAATWTSSDTPVATITAGVATGIKEGNVTITAKYTTPDGVEKTLTAPLKVNKNPNQAGDDIPIGGGGSF